MVESLDRTQASNPDADDRDRATRRRPSVSSKSSAFTLEEFFILGVLKDHEMYGLEIIRSLSAYADFGISLGTGVIYPILKNLVHEGVLTSRQDNGGRQPHVLYALTNTGWERFEFIADRLTNLGATARLLAAGIRPVP